MIHPRFQLTWDISGKKTDIIRFGGGLFTVNPVNYTQLNNIQNSGTKIASIDVSTPKIGSPNYVPVPDFVSYRNDPNTAPGLIAGVPAVSTINLNNPNIKMPHVYKANFSFNKLITQRLRIGVNFMYSHTTNNYTDFDKNLVDMPFFTLDNEAGRSVFVPASSISAKGITNSVISNTISKCG